MKVLVSICTYNREDLLRRLIADIDAEASTFRPSVVVRIYDDGSDKPNAVVRRMQTQSASRRVPIYYRHGLHYGKRGFYALMNTVLKQARLLAWDRWLHLPDDVRLAPSFFPRLERHWGAIPKGNKLLLNPLHDLRGPEPHWTGIRPKLYPEQRLYEVGWNDGCFYTNRRFVQTFPLFRKMPEWRWSKPYISSGVGWQLSVFARKYGFTLWQSADSLLYHGNHPSKMHENP